MSQDTPNAMEATMSETPEPETFAVRDYLLPDEIRLLDAWTAPGIGDTHYSAGVASRTDLRKRHGKAAKEKEQAAVSAFTALVRAGGASPEMQIALLHRIAQARQLLGPDWRTTWDHESSDPASGAP